MGWGWRYGDREQKNKEVRKRPLLVTDEMKKDAPIFDTLWRCHHRTVFVNLGIGHMGYWWGAVGMGAGGRLLT